MGVFHRSQGSAPSSLSEDRESQVPTRTQAPLHGEKAGDYDDSPYPVMTWRVALMGVLVSMGGLIFGYDTGQISGFVEMDDFLQRFGEKSGSSYVFSNVREGLIVGMVSSVLP